jgi:hypothetical protein
VITKGKDKGKTSSKEITTMVEVIDQTNKVALVETENLLIEIIVLNKVKVRDKEVLEVVKIRKEEVEIK